jgi:4-hydroxybenzoate polyprenyltransferase
MKFNFIRKNIFPYFALIRLPNLFTIPGDPIAGYLLCGGDFSDKKGIIFAVISSLSYYIFGLISNDIKDIEEDRILNPKRPIPSEKVSVFFAKIASIAALVCGLSAGLAAGSACFTTGLVLLSAIFFYNFVFKDNAILGPVLLALCRTMSVLLGFSLKYETFSALPPTLFAFISIYFAFVMGLSLAASREKNSDLKTFMPGLCMMALSVFFLSLYALHKFKFVIEISGLLPPSIYISALSLIVLLFLLYNVFAGRMIGGQKNISARVGGLISGIILIQTAFLSASGFHNESVAILSLYPLSIASAVFFRRS